MDEQSPLVENKDEKYEFLHIAAIAVIIFLIIFGLIMYMGPPKSSSAPSSNPSTASTASNSSSTGQ